MIRCLLASILSSLILIGCAAPKSFPLIEREGLNSSKVRFMAHPGAGIDLYPQTDCNDGQNIVPGAAVWSFIPYQFKAIQPRRVNMLDSVDPADSYVAEYSFQAGQTVNLGYIGSSQCIGGVSFLLRDGEQYEVKVADAQHRCIILINKLVAKEGIPERWSLENVKGLICKKPQ